MALICNQPLRNHVDFKYIQPEYPPFKSESGNPVDVFLLWPVALPSPVCLPVMWSVALLRPGYRSASATIGWNQKCLRLPTLKGSLTPYTFTQISNILKMFF